MSTRTSRGPRSFRFGDFELDARAGELRRDGERIRLQDQPFRILMMLIERPGEVVLRDEIRKRLWPNDTVVEISHGINAAVLRLREALGESAENPRFIETVARRGYRFRPDIEPAPPPDPAAPSDRYRLHEQIGAGGMGIVYRAEDLRLGRPVALKVLPREFANDSVALRRFHREARAASALTHPNICTIYGVEEYGGQPAIAMELLEGQTLETLLASGPLSIQRALGIAIPILSALDAAHRKGVAHRDLKPANVLVTRHGRQGPRFRTRHHRSRSGPRNPCHRARGHSRHAALHVARTSAGKGCRKRERHLLLRSRCSTKWSPGGGRSKARTPPP